MGKRKLTEIITIIIAAASFAGTFYFGWKLYAALQEYQEGSNIYDNAAETAFRPTATSIEDAAMAESFAKHLPAQSTEPPGYSGIDSLQVITPSAAAISTQEPFVSEVNFDALLAQNEDVKAWIQLDGSRVNYPVLQSNDNDFYLRHTIDKTWNKVGTPFIDYRCAGDFSDRITVIYGHYMENGSMFRDIHNYKSQKYFDEHPVINLYTPGGDYDLLPIAGVFQNVSDYWDFTLDFDSDAAFMHYIDNWKTVSTFKTDTEYTAEDHYVVLSLCTYDLGEGPDIDGRFFLVTIMKSKNK